MEGFKEAGMKLPTIEMVDGGVRVTVWRQHVATLPQVVNAKVDVADNVAVNLTERQLVILDILKRHVADNVADKTVPNTKYLAESLGVNRKTIQRELALLQEKNLVRWIGTDRSGHWELL